MGLKNITIIREEPFPRLKRIKQHWRPLGKLWHRDFSRIHSWRAFLNLLIPFWYTSSKKKLVHSRASIAPAYR
jgi:hypothetical protein